jgi:nucleotide-binding universal stress UspA family protein
MKYVVAYSPDSGGRAAIALARLFAGTEGISFVVCTITPATWGYPSQARVDQEYSDFLKSHATAVLDEARQSLGEDVDAEYVTRSARSITEGIIELGTELGAGLVILGSARGGPLGRFTLGGVTDSLLHSSPVPVALAPRGYRPPKGTRLQRVTCAYVGPSPAPTLAVATTLAQRHGVPLRLVTWAVRDRQMYPSLVGLQSELLVEQEWRTEAEAAQRAALAELPEELTGTAELARGTNWDDAFDAVHWEDGEMLVIGSSRLGLGRIFLGTDSNKIVRSSPVPTVLAPGTTT